MSKIFRCLLGAFVFFISPTIQASSVDAEDIRGQEMHRPVSVLQQRFFNKSKRVLLGLNSSMILREAYNDTMLTGGHVAYYINENVGFEINMNSSQITDSEDYTALRSLKYKPAITDPNDPDKLVSIDPERNRIYSMTDIGVVFAPFYGKFNIMNYGIVYADFLFTGGITTLKTDQGNKSAFQLGFGEVIYFLQDWSMRFQYRSRFFQEVRSNQSYTRHVMNLGLTIGYMPF